MARGWADCLVAGGALTVHLWAPSPISQGEPKLSRRVHLFPAARTSFSWWEGQSLGPAPCSCIRTHEGTSGHPPGAQRSWEEVGCSFAALTLAQSSCRATEGGHGGWQGVATTEYLLHARRN